MVTDFTTSGLSQSVYSGLLFFINGKRTSPISYFGSYREFLKYMTHNIIRGEYVS